jgi:hypothetical protein
MKRFHFPSIESRTTIDPVSKQFKRHTCGSWYPVAFGIRYLLAWGWIPGQARNDVFRVFSGRTHRTIATAKAGWIIIRNPEIIGSCQSANSMLPALFDACEGAA